MKKKSWIIIIGLVLVLLGVGVFAYFNNPNRLTASEQRWINDNNTNIQNINVINDVNFFGNMGEGVYYAFLNAFTERYEITFNPITVNATEKVENLSLAVGNTLPERRWV